MIRWRQYDLHDPDGTDSELTLVGSPDGFYSELLDRITPYAIQVTQGDHFAGLFDLDGAEILRVTTWEAVDAAPADVLSAVEDAYSTGNNVVERLA